MNRFYPHDCDCDLCLGKAFWDNTANQANSIEVRECSASQSELNYKQLELLSGVSSNVRGPILSISDWQFEVHALAKEKGWYDSRRSDTEILMLIADEIFEGFKEIRNNKPSYYEVDGKPEGLSVELADTVIRILDYCEYRGFDLEDLIKKKHEYNRNRSHRHGGKKL